MALEIERFLAARSTVQRAEDDGRAPLVWKWVATSKRPRLPGAAPGPGRSPAGQSSGQDLLRKFLNESWHATGPGPRMSPRSGCPHGRR